MFFAAREAFNQLLSGYKQHWNYLTFDKTRKT